MIYRQTFADAGVMAQISTLSLGLQFCFSVLSARIGNARSNRGTPPSLSDRRETAASLLRRGFTEVRTKTSRAQTWLEVFRGADGSDQPVLVAS